MLVSGGDPVMVVLGGGGDVGGSAGVPEVDGEGGRDRDVVVLEGGRV